MEKQTLDSDHGPFESKLENFFHSFHTLKYQNNALKNPIQTKIMHKKKDSYHHFYIYDTNCS